MRWAALDVDYEIYGKDIKANAHLYDNICRIIGNKSSAGLTSFVCLFLIFDIHRKFVH